MNNILFIIFFLGCVSTLCRADKNSEVLATKLDPIKGERKDLEDWQEASARLDAFEAYLQHMADAATLQQAKEDWVAAVYEATLMHLRILRETNFKRFPKEAEEKIEEFLRRFPLDKDVIYLEILYLLDLLEIVNSLPDSQFKGVMQNILAMKKDGEPGEWLNLLQARISGAKDQAERVNAMCEKFPSNRSVYKRMLHSRFRFDQENNLDKLANRCRELKLTD